MLNYLMVDGMAGYRWYRDKVSMEIQQLVSPITSSKCLREVLTTPCGLLDKQPLMDPGVVNGTNCRQGMLSRVLLLQATIGMEISRSLHEELTITSGTMFI